MLPFYLIDDVFHYSLFKLFPATGLCSLFVRAKMLYRRLVDDVVKIFVLLHTSFFLCSITECVKLRAFYGYNSLQFQSYFLTTGLINNLNCAAFI